MTIGVTGLASAVSSRVAAYVMRVAYFVHGIGSQHKHKREREMELTNETKAIVNLAKQIMRRSKKVPEWAKFVPSVFEDGEVSHISEDDYIRCLKMVYTYAMSALHTEAGLDECPEC